MDGDVRLLDGAIRRKNGHSNAKDGSFKLQNQNCYTINGAVRRQNVN